MLANKMLSKFDLSSMANNSNIIIIGKDSAGKSTLVKNILYHHKYSTTQYAIGLEAKYEYTNIPSENIFDICDYHVVDTIKQYVSSESKNNVNIESNDMISTQNVNIVIYDECSYNNQWKNNNKIIGMYKNNSDYSLTNIYTVQYPCLPTSLNNYANYIFLFKQPNPITQSVLYRSYAPKSISFDQFSLSLNEYTAKPYSCLVIDKRKQQLFYYQTELNDILPSLKQSDLIENIPIEDKFYNIIEQTFANENPEPINITTNPPTQPTLTEWLWSWFY